MPPTGTLPDRAGFSSKAETTSFLAQDSTIPQILTERLPRTISGRGSELNNKTSYIHWFCIHWRETEKEISIASTIEKWTKVKEKGTKRPMESI